LAGGEHWSLQERNELVEDAVVPGRVRVMRYGVRQPEQVVRATGAGAAAGGLVPPVLHIPFDELPARGPDDVRPQNVRPRQGEGHGVLQLIAAAEGAARPPECSRSLHRAPVAQTMCARTLSRVARERAMAACNCSRKPKAPPG